MFIQVDNSFFLFLLSSTIASAGIAEEVFVDVPTRILSECNLKELRQLYSKHSNTACSTLYITNRMFRSIELRFEAVCRKGKQCQVCREAERKRVCVVTSHDTKKKKSVKKCGYPAYLSFVIERSERRCASGGCGRGIEFAYTMIQRSLLHVVQISLYCSLVIRQLLSVHWRS